MGIVGTHLRCEAAGRGSSRDGLLEREEFWADEDIDEEDPGAIEGVECTQSNLDGCAAQLAQVRSDAFVLLQCGAAEELQGDVQGFWRGPAEIFSCIGSDAIDHSGEIACSGDG